MGQNYGKLLMKNEGCKVFLQLDFFGWVKNPKFDKKLVCKKNIVEVMVSKFIVVFIIIIN